ncbi:MAG: hypothetical protein ABIX01_04725 [Chitinophagaceae bacterium]
MEFEDMKKIWDSQNSQPLYAIDEQGLHNRILSKKRLASKITKISELMGIIAYIVTGCFIFGVTLYKQNAGLSSYKQNGSLFMYILAVWLFASALYIVKIRILRIRGSHRFDRSMNGDLGHAISVAMHQVQLSLIMRWNMLPIGLLTALSISETGKSPWFTAGILVFFASAAYFSGWEHGIYKKRKLELEKLQNKLANS